MIGGLAVTTSSPDIFRHVSYFPYVEAIKDMFPVVADTSGFLSDYVCGYETGG
jgi:hypothetical protein